MKAIKQFLMLSIFIGSGFGLFAQTSGELSVTVSTSNAGGGYAPKNIVAVWVEDAQGNFVKTLLAYAQNRITHLNTWENATTDAGVQFDRTDAITGATQSSHSTRSCTWDGTDYTGSPVDDGQYFIWMELTDKNATGNYSSFEITKGTDTDFQTPGNVPSFSDITLSWEPDQSINITRYTNNADYRIFPNPGAGLYKVSNGSFDCLEVRSINGKLLAKTKEDQIDISSFKSGNYLLYIKNSQATVVKMIVKQ